MFWKSYWKNKYLWNKYRILMLDQLVHKVTILLQTGRLWVKILKYF